MPEVKLGLLHYSASPVVGGVEAVMSAHARLFLAAGYPVTFITGVGSEDALPLGASLVLVLEMGTQHPDVLAVQAALDQGRIPESFNILKQRLRNMLGDVLAGVDVLIVHNVFFKHFNLALTTALVELVNAGAVKRCISWGHDFTWTSPNSRGKAFSGYPWDIMRQPNLRIKQVTISAQRRQELAELLGVPEGIIAVVYNGVDLETLLGISDEGLAFIRRLDLLSGDLNVILPVRITIAKNIELALQVMDVLKHHRKRPHLVITGPPDPHDADSMAYFRSLQHMRDALGLTHHVHFAFESGLDPREPNYLTDAVVSDLMRVSDLLLLPSHREGFGMPVLEAGLTGLPVVASESVPAALEIGRTEVRLFRADDSPQTVARIILEVLDASPTARLRTRTRQAFRWEQIFKQQIEPLILKE